MSSSPADDVEIKHTDHIISDLKKIFQQDAFSDVTLIVENVRIPVHRVILASRSEYFRALLYGGMRESDQKEIVLHETDLAPFKILLEYVYTGVVNLSKLKVDVLCGVLGLANQYGFPELERDMIFHMKSVLNERNVCSLYQVAFGFNMNDLSGTCLKACAELLLGLSFSDLAPHQKESKTALRRSLRNQRILRELCVDFEAAESENRYEHISHLLCSRYSLAVLWTLFVFVDRYAKNVLESPEMLQLNAQALKQLLLRSSLCAREIDVFNFVRQWAARNSDPQGLQVLLDTVRWELLADKELVGEVRQSNLLHSDRILDIIASKQNNTALTSLHCNHRGFLDPGVNVALSNFGALVIQGEMSSGSLLDSDGTSYDHERGYIRHSIEPSDKTGNCVHVKLGMPCIINHIRMLLWDKDQRSYSYYVQLSYDGLHWTKVIDYSHPLCRSWQELYFPACTVQHIKVVGTHNTVNKSFHLVKLEAMWLESIPELKNGIIVPTENVVSLAKNAAVLEGVSRSRNALINGSLAYDWDNGYCCHQIGSGQIMVQLSQPYYLSSLRMLLWDVDDRHYTYVIHTSATGRDGQWMLAVDTRESPRRSWQSHRFSLRQVCFIRLTGINNTANEVFHVVHLEAPDQSLPSASEVAEDALGMDDLESILSAEEPALIPAPSGHLPPVGMVVPQLVAGSRSVHLEGGNDEERSQQSRRRSRNGGPSMSAKAPKAPR